LQESFIPLPASNSQVGNDGDSDSTVSAENGSNSGVCHDDHESDLTPEAEATPLEALEVPCMEELLAWFGRHTGSVRGDTSDFPVGPWAEVPRIDCADKKDKKDKKEKKDKKDKKEKKETNEKKEKKEKREKKERKEKKEESSRDRAESVGKCLQESFIQLPASNSQVGNDSDSDSTVSAENRSNSGVCHDDHESDLIPEAETTPLEALEVPCMEDAINHDSSLLGSADAQVEEKPDGVCGDTNDLPITPWTEEPSIDCADKKDKKDKNDKEEEQEKKGEKEKKETNDKKGKKEEKNKKDKKEKKETNEKEEKKEKREKNEKKEQKEKKEKTKECDMVITRG